MIAIHSYTNGASEYVYGYDAFGRRISATENNVTRDFIYDGLDVITELNGSSGLTKYYTRCTGLGGGIGDIAAECSPTKAGGVMHC